ncbi:GIY-YIG nuclease family protein [Streptomyces mirabilis]|uniref:hypothetical protein n=1 Tax=Streptomyces mirabilis TaxID=68239 RepID=UPI0036A113A4
MPAGEMSEIRARSWAEFKIKAATYGIEVTESEYLGSKGKHRATCKGGHEIFLFPNAVQQTRRITCTACRGASSQIKKDFEEKIHSYGGEILNSWTATKALYLVRCTEGHESSIKPINLLKMEGICKICNEATRQLEMLSDFKERVEALGGQVLEETWLGAQTPHRCICPKGHVCTPRPCSIKSGQGMCFSCSGSDPVRAWESFVSRMIDLGAEVLEESWLGAETPHRVRCKGGHEISVWPSGAGKGKGICRICVGLDPKTAEKYFRNAIENLGGVILYKEWKGVNVPHQVLCPEGHIASPRPNDIQQGHTMCRSCAGKDPGTAWENFKELVSGLGGNVLEKSWLGVQVPHLVQCRNGHTTTVRPAGVQQGQGICRFCAGCEWDVFYVVVNEADGHLKFGITSGDSRHRLRFHKADGFIRVVRLLTALPGTDAPTLEKTLIQELKAQGKQPVRGREYYLISELPFVLNIVDAYQANGAVAIPSSSA